MSVSPHLIRVIPRITAAMSVLGSGSILFSALRNTPLVRRSLCCCVRKDDSDSTPVVGQSLLLGMSLADLLSSLSYVVGDVMYPESKGGKGNQATCNFQGFVCNLQVAAALYSGFLAWYYCLYIRYRWRHERIRQWFEPCAHIVSWLFVFATGIAAILKQLYHPHWIRCYISGPNTNLYFWTLFYLPIWVSILSGSVAMFLVYGQVRKTETRSLQHTFQRQASSFQQPEHDNSTASPNLSELPKTRRVAYQALCYTIAFILCYVFPTTSRIWSTFWDKPPTLIRLLATSTVTCQGLLNWIVYNLQPRLYNWWTNKNRQQQRRRQATPPPPPADMVARTTTITDEPSSVRNGKAGERVEEEPS